MTARRCPRPIGWAVLAVVAASLAVAAASLLVAPAVARSDVGTWTSNGPYSGTIRALALAPAAPSTLYAGTRQGVFRSTDGGARWAPASDGLPHLGIEALAVAPADRSTVYASTLRGFARSTDGGARWEPVAVRGPDGVDRGLGISTIATSPRAPSSV